VSTNQIGEDCADTSVCDGLGEYSWEIVHNSTVVEYGVVRPGEGHPWTGSTADTHFEVGSGLFEMACACAVDDSRDAIVEARAEGRAEPAPVEVVTVRLRDRDGTDLVSMTAHLPQQPITDADVAAYIEMLAEWAEQDRLAAIRRQQQQEEQEEEPVDDAYVWPGESAVPHSSPRVEVAQPVADPRDPQQRLIDDLVDEAVDLRGSVVDPEDCRRRLFHAEQRLAETKKYEQRVAATSDDAALAEASDRVARCARRVGFWWTRLAESTETYLQAAALDAEAAHLSRELDGRASARQ
jgi:hypothetical protein